MAMYVNNGTEYMGGSSNQIYSIEDLKQMGDLIGIFSEGVENFDKQLGYIIHSFESKGVVQSFYESGNFGQDQKNRLKELQTAVENYRAVIDENLIPQTKNFVENQIARLNNKNSN